MRLLVDTHVLLWAVNDPDKISAAAVSAMVDPSNDLLVSIASVWELAIKIGLGRLQFDSPLKEWLDRAVQQHGMQCLAITVAHCDEYSRLTGLHKDPFDRMLAAQAIAESIPIASADSALDTFPGLKRIW